MSEEKSNPGLVKIKKPMPTPLPRVVRYDPKVWNTYSTLLEEPEPWTIGLFDMMSITVAGGPYDYVGSADFGVKLDSSSREPCEVYCPIQDWSVPLNKERFKLALMESFKAALRGEKVYVGCMGGRGRTGLFLASMGKVAGYSHPIKTLREQWKKTAVETIQQEKWVEALDVRRETRQLRWLTLAARMHLTWFLRPTTQRKS